MSAQIHYTTSGLTTAASKLTRRIAKRAIFARHRPETFQQYSDRLTAYITSPKGIEAALAKPATASYTRKKR
ncbi:UNVERIFIED_ORG: hypothetical protein J3D58_000448 [Paenarthrobacter nicotinovorans]